MTRDPMDDGAYMTAYPEYENISAAAQIAAAHRQRDDLKALVGAERDASTTAQMILAQRAEAAEARAQMLRAVFQAMMVAYSEQPIGLWFGVLETALAKSAEPGTK